MHRVKRKLQLSYQQKSLVWFYLPSDKDWSQVLTHHETRVLKTTLGTCSIAAIVAS